MAGQKSGIEFATQHKTHNLVLTSDVPLPLSPPSFINNPFLELLDL